MNILRDELVFIERLLVEITGSSRVTCSLKQDALVETS